MSQVSQVISNDVFVYFFPEFLVVTWRVLSSWILWTWWLQAAMGCNSTKPAEAPISNQLKSQLKQKSQFFLAKISANHLRIIRYYVYIYILYIRCHLNMQISFWPIHADSFAWLIPRVFLLAVLLKLWDFSQAPNNANEKAWQAVSLYIQYDHIEISLTYFWHLLLNSSILLVSYSFFRCSQNFSALALPGKRVDLCRYGPSTIYHW